jgi:hypothetical protein
LLALCSRSELWEIVVEHLAWKEPVDDIFGKTNPCRMGVEPESVSKVAAEFVDGVVFRRLRKVLEGVPGKVLRKNAEHRFWKPGYRRRGALG